MSSSLIPQLDVPLFAGHGTTAAYAASTRAQAAHDATSALGSLLLSACHQAFVAELEALTPDELADADVNPDDFRAKDALISILRYAAFVEASATAHDSLTPFTDILKRNREHRVGILGLSSGIIPACVVASSLSSASFIYRAVEAFKLAFWLGVRTQIHRKASLDATSSDPAAPWGLVIGLGKSSAEQAIATFAESQTEPPSLHITAVMDNAFVTVSGLPHVLAAFSATLPQGTLVYETTLDTLYHSPVLESVRADVLADLTRRNVQFPAFSDIVVPIRSTLTGEPLDASTVGPSLAELIVDMLLLHPVNWDLVVPALVKAVPEDLQVRLINVGPGSGLVRGIEKALPSGRVSSADLTAPRNLPSRATPKQEPIAIVGMAVNMPGAPSAAKLWELLEQGINMIAEIPEHRFKVSDYADGKGARAMKAHTGNFVDGVDEFDNKFFKISPREARSMDPQQRLLLHASYEALENAGYVPNSSPTSDPENFGCYVGVATHDYIQNLRNDIDVYYSTGTLGAFMSGRISYAMQMSGPSVVVDTACSSSTVAVYQGCRALMTGDCDAALVGGVNVIASPDVTIGLDRGHFLSATGQCKAFDAAADGYSRSDGVGMFVIKRLADALAEGDRVLGVIRGVEVNQSGRAHSITHPHAPTQTRLFTRVLGQAGIDAHRVSVIEAHGTGTQAGDPTELESIRSVFAVRRAAANPLHITSVKANIGHLEAASGAAGLAKLLLMLRHRAIPQQISLRTLNPRIAPLEADHVVIDRENAEWTADAPRVALLNNFGAAGSNAALLLEEHVPKPAPGAPAGTHFAVGLSAKTETALQELRARYVAWLKTPEAGCTPFADVAYTATARRQIYPFRLAASAGGHAALAERLAAAPVVQAGEAPGAGRAVFVFSGQGDQYLGMGGALYRTAPVFRAAVDECEALLVARGFPGVRAIIEAGKEGSGLGRLDEFEANQAAIFAVEIGLARMWMAWGVRPAAVVGHSLGEYAALVVAGVLRLKDALLLIAARVRLMVQRCAVDATGMIAVNMAPENVAAALAADAQFATLTIACYNSPVDCVLSGPLEAVKAFKLHLDKEVRCRSIVLHVPFGFHSAAMDPLLAEYTAAAERAHFAAPAIPVVSNVTGQVVLPGDKTVFDGPYLARHCAEPVQFDAGLRALGAQPDFATVDAWIAIGPHTATLSMLKASPAVRKDSLQLVSLKKDVDAWETLSASLAKLYTSSVPVTWRAVWAHVPSATVVDLPSYPFEKAKFWVQFEEEAPRGEAAGVAVKEEVAVPPMVAPMLRTFVQLPSRANGMTAVFETPIEDLADAIKGHSVGGVPLCPASVYLEQALSGLGLAHSHLQIAFDDSHVVLRRIEFSAPLVYDPLVARTVVTSITLHDTTGTFIVSSRVGGSAAAVHVRGEYRVQPTPQTTTKFARALPGIVRQMGEVVTPRGGDPPEVFSTRTAYEVIFPRVVTYAREYHTMRALTVDARGMEGVAAVRLPPDHVRAPYVVHPVFMDTLLHVAGFVANMQGGVNDAYICSEVGTVKVLPGLVDNDAAYDVYCNNVWLAEEGIMLAEAYAVDTRSPRRIVAHLKDMHFRRVRLNSLMKSLAHAAGKAAPGKKAASAKAQIQAAPQVSVAQAAARITEETTSNNTQVDVVKILSETCGIPAESLDMHSDLAALGVDSLMLIEIVAQLQVAFPHAALDANALAHCQSVADIVKEVAAKPALTRSASGTSSPRTLVPDEKYIDPPALSIDGELDVKRVLASVLGVDAHEIGDESDFDALGLDSLTSIEALQALKDEFALDLPGDFFTICPTLLAVNAYIANLRPTIKAKVVEFSAKPTFSPPLEPHPSPPKPADRTLRVDNALVPLQSIQTDGRLPLFLFHDGSGVTNHYGRVSPLGRLVWGIDNPNLSTAKPWDSVNHMAAAYSNFILSASSGSVILGGWSFGGIAAYETALQLAKKGVAVKGVVLIDSPSPINHVPLSQTLIDSVLKLEARVSESEFARLIKAQFTMNAEMLRTYDPFATGGVCPPLVMLRSREGFNPPGVSGVPVWLADRSDPHTSVMGWETVAGGPVKLFDIPGHHFQPFAPANVGEVSRQISDACAYLESL